MAQPCVAAPALRCSPRLGIAAPPALRRSLASAWSTTSGPSRTWQVAYKAVRHLPSFRGAARRITSGPSPTWQMAYKTVRHSPSFWRADQAGQAGQAGQAHKTMADLFPNGFIWSLFCPDLEEAICEPRYTHLAHFGMRYDVRIGSDSKFNVGSTGAERVRT